MIVSRPQTLRYLGPKRNKGKCKWRLDFNIDDIPYSAFYNPAAPTRNSITEQDVNLLAIPLIIDLTAEVKPKQVIIQNPAGLTDFTELYTDAVTALLNEQAAEWKTTPACDAPPLHCRWRPPKRTKKKETLNEVVVGFSGGKDSIVTIFTLLEAGYHVHPFLLNEGDRTWQQHRTWISKLKRLGLKPVVSYFLTSRRKKITDSCGEKYLSCYQIGFLVAAMALYAEKMNINKVVLGIENSPEKSGFFYGRTFINHQHQKTRAHLNIMEKTFRKALNIKLRIASPIASLSDSEVLGFMLDKVPTRFQKFSSCGAANSTSRHCGCCDKCAFVFALLQKTKKGRRLSHELFKRDLFYDVEIYRPWLDRRFRNPIACIGSAEEVWASFEQNLLTDSDKPVLDKWRLSTTRKIYLSTKSPIKKTKENRLEKPVIHASRIVKKWKKNQ